MAEEYGYDVCQLVQLTEGWANSSVTPKKQKKGKKGKKKEPFGFYQRKQKGAVNA